MCANAIGGSSLFGIVSVAVQIYSSIEMFERWDMTAIFLIRDEFLTRYLGAGRNWGNQVIFVDQCA